MDTRKLVALLEAVQMNSINKAAKKLDYTQSGMMYMINALETEIGVHILKRNHKGVELSEEGKALEPFMRQMVDGENALFQKVQELNEKGKIRIAAYPSIAANWLPNVIDDFRKEVPGVEIELRTGVYEIQKWLDNDEIDLGFLERGLAGENNWIPVKDDLMYAVVPASSSLALNSCISLEKLIENQFILFPSINAKNAVTMMLKNRNIEIKNKMEVSTADASSLLAMVERGLGVTFLSKLYMRECPDTVCMLPLDPPYIRTLGIVMKPHRSPSTLMKKFITCLKEHDLV